MVNSATKDGAIYTFSVNILLMDIVDKDSNSSVDEFRGNDNEQDILNTQLAVGARLIEMLERGDLHSNKYQLNGTPTFEPFTERFENYLAGWALSFQVDLPSDATIC